MNGCFGVVPAYCDYRGVGFVDPVETVATAVLEGAPRNTSPHSGCVGSPTPVSCVVCARTLQKVSWKSPSGARLPTTNPGTTLSVTGGLAPFVESDSPQPCDLNGDYFGASCKTRTLRKLEDAVCRQGTVLKEDRLFTVCAAVEGGQINVNRFGTVIL
ncbi:hypothetical protein BV898_15801 [Hypsibius exemplaris]|uniref:Uncharacterized protein n=1 Tax=Hypsibius exemplaris TaxID=2072580 RepID=A0A9X6NDH6_HYPEX|nr:hypothetical protein BV898_15801 [Hypsibius exemplaris]